MLIIVGALVQIGYTKIDNAEVTLNKDDREAAALSCYEAAAIYGAIMILCIIRYWVPTRSSVKKEDDRGWFPTLDNNDAAPMSRGRRGGRGVGERGVRADPGAWYSGWWDIKGRPTVQSIRGWRNGDEEVLEGA
eukprot:CAMPEP_0119119770 /NCGR_PEP_ID=MMETSP1310-20130426/1114_1 /TAXON_ID=464262 /ORGANISM="Genus nov. species nov., Strain RCC2339" /LENGTH=133 /DNA_ID=CAMNT_0007109217 /DNA_START=246 /DNA_END=648 /DNA_ORIENTATION=+